MLDISFNKTINAKLLSSLHNYNNRNYAEALLLVEEFLIEEEENHQGWFLKSLIYSALNQAEDAINAINKALQGNENIDNYFLKKASLLTSKGDFEAAIETYIALIDKSPTNSDALLQIAGVYLETRKFSQATIALLRAAAIRELPSKQKTWLFASLKLSNIQRFSEPVVTGLLNVLDYRELNPQAISNCIQNYLFVKYQLNKKTLNLNLNTVIQDTLFLKALPIIRLCSIEAENFLNSLRATVTQLILSDSAISLKMLPLARALALNSYASEYVGYVNPLEVELVEKTQALLAIDLKTPNWAPQKSEKLLLILAMYTDLYRTPCASALLEYNLNDWPPLLFEIANKSLFKISEELRTSRQIESLTAIENTVSREVQAQYEENPYPRWDNFSVGALDTVGSLLVMGTKLSKDSFPRQLFDPQSPILVAGSGTGKQPLSVAKRFPQTEVIGVDISRRSLAYSTLKAKELGIENVKFYHADILHLPDSLGKFYYIECCGVLHHMGNPLDGFKKLLSMLEPGGVMKIALYSTIARRKITLERNKIAKLKLEPTEKNIRMYRQALMNKIPRSPITTSFTDFYNLSECRDLLFHQHEKTYTWPEIESICKNLDLNFLGIFDNLSIDNAFKEFNDKGDPTSFADLETFENANPDAFSSMYQFLVQKPLN